MFSAILCFLFVVVFVCCLINSRRPSGGKSFYAQVNSAPPANASQAKATNAKALTWSLIMLVFCVSSFIVFPFVSVLFISQLHNSRLVAMPISAVAFVFALVSMGVTPSEVGLSTHF
jgi:hypothetical protein